MDLILRRILLMDLDLDLVHWEVQCMPLPVCLAEDQATEDIIRLVGIMLVMDLILAQQNTTVTINTSSQMLHQYTLLTTMVTDSMVIKWVDITIQTNIIMDSMAISLINLTIIIPPTHLVRMVIILRHHHHHRRITWESVHMVLLLHHHLPIMNILHATASRMVIPIIVLITLRTTMLM
jgi:hypothetical protein